MSSLQVESLYLYPLENAKQHKTERFELVHDEENPVAVLRRGISFTIAVRFANREYDDTKDSIKFIFNFGKPFSNIIIPHYCNCLFHGRIFRRNTKSN